MNKRIRNVLLTAGLSAILLHPTSFSQPGMGPGGGGMGQANPARMYDPTTVVTVAGTVAHVDTIKGTGRMAGGVHFTLKSDTSSIEVHLGPGWFLETQSVKIAVGDRVSVTGSKIVYQGKPVIIAATVKKGEENLRLRDNQGTPSWSGKRP